MKFINYAGLVLAIIQFVEFILFCFGKYFPSNYAIGTNMVITSLFMFLIYLTRFITTKKEEEEFFEDCK